VTVNWRRRNHGTFATFYFVVLPGANLIVHLMVCFAWWNYSFFIKTHAEFY
jgi:hypothetical protein